MQATMVYAKLQSNKRGSVKRKSNIGKINGEMQRKMKKKNGQTSTENGVRGKRNDEWWHKRLGTNKLSGRMNTERERVREKRGG